MFKKLKAATKHNIAFWICLGISIVLIIGGAVTPPPFVIDASIFIATGELFAFASLGAVYKALDKGVDAKIEHGETKITLNNDDNVEKVD